MRVTVYVCSLLLSLPAVAFAQGEWAEYVSVEDGFRILFPGQAQVSRITWMSESGLTLPGRVHSVDNGREHYSVTVVDYSGIEQLGIERAKNCPVVGFETCEGGAVQGVGYWKHDTRGAIVYATHKLMQRDVDVTELTWGQQDLVEGHYLQTTSRADRSRTMAFIAMNRMKLYIFEATVPPGSPPPLVFQVSQRWVDEKGEAYRYRSMYNNEFHEIEGYPRPEANPIQD